MAQLDRATQAKRVARPRVSPSGSAWAVRSSRVMTRRRGRR